MAITVMIIIRNGYDTITHMLMHHLTKMVYQNGMRCVRHVSIRLQILNGMRNAIVSIARNLDSQNIQKLIQTKSVARKTLIKEIQDVQLRKCKGQGGNKDGEILLFFHTI